MRKFLLFLLLPLCKASFAPVHHLAFHNQTEVISGKAEPVLSVFCWGGKHSSLDKVWASLSFKLQIGSDDYKVGGRGVW